MLGRNKFGGLLAGLVLMGCVVGWVYYKKGEHERQARDGFIAEVTSLDAYSANRDVIDPIVAHAHEVAFDTAYRFRLPSKRRRNQAFQPDTYRQVAYAQLTSALKTAGREDLAVAAERLRAAK